MNDDRMPDWVETVFVGPRVEGREIEVVDLFPVLDHVIQLDGIGASPEEGISRLESGHEFKGLDELTHALVLLLESFPLAFPHGNDVVAFSEQGILFEDGGFVHIAHGLVWSHILCRVLSRSGKHRGHPCQKQPST